jgi:hypothetical protein
MTTWTCKGPFTAFALLLLGGCDEGGLALGRGTASGPSATQSQPLSKVRMAGGAVRLVAPAGYCIDRESLQPGFALLARCDILGATSSDANVPLAVIAVSLLPAPEASAPPAPELTAAAAGLTSVTQSVITDQETIFRATGAAPAPGLSGDHWRGTALIKGHLLGVALYGPDRGRPIGEEGRGLLRKLIRATRAASR